MNMLINETKGGTSRCLMGIIILHIHTVNAFNNHKYSRTKAITSDVVDNLVH